ncbi:twin-arginine translocation pathway signal protein [Ahrensia marina]|uniref:Acg family FMN-binding oxidoreductase n=1 Tax=Ahrensia marina TaxID=1514904 RepID=UPI0035D060B2
MTDTPSPKPSQPSRRTFVRVLGAGGIILGASALGAGTWVTTRDPATAREPWQNAGQGDDVRVRALSYAILAPNAHNRQPWSVDLSEPGSVTLYCDLDRRLPETDPFDRQITVSLGCFIELFTLAAAEEGFGVEANLFPQGEPSPRLDARPVARLQLAPGNGTRDPLFAQIVNRHTNKEPFDTARSVPAGDVAAVLAASGAAGSLQAGSTLEDAKILELRELTWRGHEIESFTPRTLQESIDLMRIGKAEVLANPDGIDLSGPLFESLNVAGLLTREQIADTTSTAFQQGLDAYREMIFSAMGYVWLISDGDTRAEQIAAGRAYVRMHLEATARGIDVHPLSQALQEYEEIAELYSDAKTTLGAQPTQTVQMLARIGYGPTIKASPRWLAETRIRNT